jgi:SAM-dependent methyltransferase
MDNNNDTISILNFDTFENDLIINTKNILKDIKKGDEFEIGFKTKDFLISSDKYINLLKYFVKLSKDNQYKIIQEQTLNISYNYDYENYNNYRITVSGLENINEKISQIYQRENHVIFSLLLGQYMNGDKSISAINKIKEKKNMLDMGFLRARLSNETDIEIDKGNELLQLSEKERQYINFRYIQRVSLIIEDNPEYIIRIDLSQVKTSNKVILIEKNNSVIELEIDVSFKKAISKQKLDNCLKIMSTTILDIQKLLQKSSIVLNRIDQNNIIFNLKNILQLDPEFNLKDLPAMQTQAAEITHIVDLIPNKYSVTDKADGERYFLLIFEGGVYLISNTLEVKKMNTSHLKNIEEYNNTIIDGEYLYIANKKKFVFLAFDILSYKGEDSRKENILSKRLEKLANVTKTLFKQKSENEQYVGDFNLDKINKHYEKNIITFITELNNKLDQDYDNIIMTKNFIFPIGGHPCEVYSYSILIWNLYTKNSKINCPYILDGIIYTGIDQIYTRNSKETKNRIYKWKPSSKNSLDFYVLYERNKDTHQILNVFDDSEQNTENTTKEIENTVSYQDLSTFKNKASLYRILNLYVGKMEGGKEYPILFQKENNNYIANLYIQDGEARDVEGNVIQDNTVVEFTYINDPTVAAGFRWVPLRTRHDKTDSIRLYKRKYGNNSEIAEKTWRSMMDGIELSDIELLSKINTYDAHNKKLKSRITTDAISMERRENVYYQIISNLAENLRAFHNWIKSNLIYTYCGIKKVNGKEIKLDILDIGCGKGGDIIKFFHSRINTYLGFDLDPNGIYSGSDGALSRYQNIKKKFPNFPKMNFFVADGGSLLTYEDQRKVLGTMTDQNKKILEELEVKDHKTFDVINCQFAVHYFFKNDITLNNFLENIKKFLRPSGYLLLTTFDANLVNKNFDENNHIISYYTTKTGTKKILFDVVKNYTEKDTEKTGLTIDVHLPAFEDDHYESEYLVNPNFLERKMKEIGLNLVDTGLFGNYFEQCREFFEKVAKGEENNSTKKYYMDVNEFYNMDDTVNKGSYEFSKLNRFYVFQKEDKSTGQEIYKLKSSNINSKSKPKKSKK